jgi:hypothetical protein
VKAEGDEPAAPEPSVGQPISRHPVQDVLLDKPHDLLSRRVEALSRDLDALLGDPNRLYDSTGSTAQMRAGITDFEGGHTEGKVNGTAQISLPNTEDRFKVLIHHALESSTETAAERDIRDVTGTAPGRPSDNNFYVGLKALAARSFGVQLSAEGGVRVRSSPDLYARIRVFRDFTLSDWTLRLAETPLWTKADGYSALTEASLDKPLGERWHFRFTSKANWRETTHYFDLGQIASLIHTPNPKTSVALDLGAFGPSKPDAKPTFYSIALRGRRLAHRDWLYVELTPQLFYPESNGYRPIASLTLQVEVLFGDRYLSTR